MITAGRSSSTSVSTVGHVLTALPLYCPVCRHCFERTLPGRVLRVNGQLWIFSERHLYRLAYRRRPRCPLCGRRKLYLRERL